MKKLQRGVTIVELVVYMALMSILLLVLLDVFTTTLNTKLSSESTAAISQDTRYILAKLTYDINNADSVTSPALGTTSSTLQLVNSGATSTYSLSLGNFTKSVGGVPMNLNGTDTSLTSVSFKNIGNAEVGSKPTIQISFTIKSEIVLQGDRQEEQTINTTIGTR